jgi:BRCA1-associated protein
MGSVQDREKYGVRQWDQTLGWLLLGMQRGELPRARYESLEGRNTELGFGIVHLSRGGEETSGLDNGVDIYPAEKAIPTESPVVEKVRTMVKEVEEKIAPHCYIPAMPSYLTPSDFLGFVGEDERTG